MSEKKILVTEDDGMMSRMYSILFAEHRTPFHVDLVADGAQAVARIAQEEYDLVITDLNMPDLDGRNLYLRVQEICRDECRKMPLFLFCSGVSSALDEVEEFCSESGNCRMLKPFSMSQLQDMVQQMTADD